MFEWLLNGTIVIAVIGTLRLVSHRWLLQQLGAVTLYSLWLVLPMSLMLLVLANFWPQQQVNSAAWLWVVEAQQQVQQMAMQNHSSWLVVSWLVGVTLALAWLVSRWPLLQPKWQLGRLRVVRTPRGESPAMTGILRPTLLLPRDFAQRFSAQQRHLILMHEQQHWLRADTSANLLAYFVCAVFWFHPVAWLCYRRFRRDQELACDAQVLADAAPRQRASYAQALLQVAATTHLGAQYNPNLYRYGAYNTMKERIQLLKQPQRLRYLPMVCATLVSLAVVGAWQAPVIAANSQQSEATPIVRINPSYPTTAAEQGIEGQVTLSFSITTDGKVSDVEVVESQPQGVFDEAAVAALQKWRYHPEHAGAGHKVALAFQLASE